MNYIEIMAERRKHFETRLIANGLDYGSEDMSFDKHTAMYYHPNVQFLWKCWQAGRASV